MATKRNPIRVVKDCGNCGRPVSRPASAAKENVFCNRQCYLSSDFHANNVRRRMAEQFPESKTKVEVVCTHCGRTFLRRRYKALTPKQPFCDRSCQYAALRSRGIEQINQHGYVLVFVGKGQPGASKSGHILQHRKVMQEMLGRPLRPEENVHHKNGIRTDNRPENLELWSRSQPSGQRVSDKIKWAEEILALYAALPKELRD